jgi:class 3 adenylate cyclase
LTTESVTVLFTDMVGSTALATSLTPDAADEYAGIERRAGDALRRLS